MGKISEAIAGFAAYEDGTEFLGIVEAKLPEISHMTQEISGAGIAGKYEAVIAGHFDAMTLTLNFRNITGDAMKLAEPRYHHLDLRAVVQSKNTATGMTVLDGIKHSLVVQPKKTDVGKIASASTGDASGEYVVSYYAIFMDGKKVLEIDIHNFIYIVNGVDYLAKVRTALGK